MKNIILFYILLIFLLGLRFILLYSSLPTYKDGQEVNFKTSILTDPKVSGGYQTIYLNLDPINKVLVKANLDTEYFYGDKIQIVGNLKLKLLNDNSTILVLDRPKISLKNDEISPFLALIYSTRQRIIMLFQNNLDQKSAGLMLGIVFGIKTNLPQDFLDQIKVTGITHVIAASGMNVTMVSALLFYFFALFFKRQWAIVLSIAGIALYTIISGFQASIIRAAIMGIIVFSAQILGKQKNALHILLVTAFIMLFFFPQFLLDTGFQLSFAATLGLLYLPKLFGRLQNGITEDLITTLCAQASTLPILIINFGNYSVFSILANALVLWTVPILMILGSIGAIFGLLFEPAGAIFLLLCVPLVSYFEKIVAIFSNLGSTFVLSQVPWQFVVAYYFFLIGFVVYKSKRS